jgi:hypothetical protein
MDKRIILLITCLLACSSPLYATRVEVTPWLGYQFGGSFEDVENDVDYDFRDTSAAGAMVNVDLTDITQLEFYFGRQETEVKSGGMFPTDTLFDLDIDYYHIGGTLLISEDKWQPFVVGTIGITHLDPDLTSADSESYLSMGLGGGVRFLPTKHLGLYLGIRGIYTFVDTTVRGSSGPGGGTIAVRADGILQGVLQAGLIFRF